MIQAKIIADSINEFGDRIITYVCKFPRYILAELNTHRMFSRNSASSRAIPFKKMLELVETDPFIPIAWQKDHKGMQGTEYFTDPVDIQNRRTLHLMGRDYAISVAQAQSELGVTKQICNRYLEPFMWHTAIITATEYDNFFDLRCPKYVIPSVWNNVTDRTIFRSKRDIQLECYKTPFVEMSDLDWIKMNKGQADIHIMVLAEAMWDARSESTPNLLKAGEWHIPFGDQIDEQRIVDTFDRLNDMAILIMSQEDIERAKLEIATARCARVSYLNFEGKNDYVADFKLYKQIKDSKHASPFEHCAVAMSKDEYRAFIKGQCAQHMLEEDAIIAPVMAEGWCNNFKGFIQHRYQLGL